VRPGQQRHSFTATRVKKRLDYIVIDPETVFIPSSGSKDRDQQDQLVLTTRFGFCPMNIVELTITLQYELLPANPLYDYTSNYVKATDIG